MTVDVKSLRNALTSGVTLGDDVYEALPELLRVYEAWQKGPVGKVLEPTLGDTHVGWLTHPAPDDGTYLYAMPRE